MKKLLVMLCALAMVFSLASLAAVETVDVVKASATIDGVIGNGEWAGATAWQYKISDLSTSKTAEGLGIQGTGAETCPDLTARISFMIDADYLYILETRSGDTTPFYGSANPGLDAHEGDGSYLFFMKNGAYSNALGIVPQLKGKTVPGIGTGAPLASDKAEIACTMTADGWVLEAKVKLSAIGFTYDDFANGIIGFSYCASNAMTDKLSAGAATGGWCQIDFEGIGVWNKGPKAVLVDAPAPAPETVPAETVPATVPAETAPTTTPAATTPTTGGISLIAVAGLGLVAASLASKKRK